MTERAPGTSGGRRVALPGGEMPSGAFLLSALAPVVAAVLRVALPPDAGTYTLLIWLLGLFPVFLLTRYMGWRGALVALVWTGLLVVLSELTVGVLTQHPTDFRLVGAVTVIIAAAALGAGVNEQWWWRGMAEKGTGTPAQLRGGDEGLPGRAVMEYFLSKVFAGARREPPLSIVLLEVDRFQEYGQLYGSGAVAQAMETVVGSLRKHTRAMNVFGRYEHGGILVLLQGEGLEGCHAFTQRILEETASTAAPWKGRVTLSAGIAGFEPSIENPETLIGHARRALDTAQSMGGNCSVIFKGNVDETLVTPGMIVLHPDGQVKEIHRAF